MGVLDVGYRRIGRACTAFQVSPLKVRLKAPNSYAVLPIVSDLSAADKTAQFRIETRRYSLRSRCAKSRKRTRAGAATNVGITEGGCDGIVDPAIVPPSATRIQTDVPPCRAFSACRP